MSAQEAAAFNPGALVTKFVEPPFSILDTRSGRWQDRRRSWLSLGLRSELGRGADAQAFATEGTRAGGLTATTVGKGLISQATERTTERVVAEAGLLYDDEVSRRVARMGTDYDTEAGENAWGGSGTSIFDPVLCELAYRWWAPEGGRVLDPFAGGSVRGVVAAMLGHPYTGIDLSAAQLNANREQAAAILGPEHPVPVWTNGNTLDVLPTLEGPYDMVMTCPPYFDLEVYSDDPRDLSNVPWGEFVELYAQAMSSSARLLAPDRFSVWVVSEIRDPQGYCRGLVPLTVQVAEAAGLRLYNEAILVNSPGSLPVRVTRYMEASRKLGRSHQNVLCFIKGSPPRGWSYERPAPPSPQLGLGLDTPDTVVSGVGEVLAAENDSDELDAGVEGVAWVGPSPGEAVPFVVPPHMAGTLVATLTDGTVLEQHYGPGEVVELRMPAAGTLTAAAIEATDDEGPQPAAPSPSAATAPEAAPDSAVAASAAVSAVVEARTLDREDWQRQDDGRWLELATGGLELEPPEEWWLRFRADLWHPRDMDRPCWSCGRAGTGEFKDGSPSYDHSHHPEVLAMFTQEGTS